MMTLSKHVERKSALRKCALAGLAVPLIIAAATGMRAVRAQAIAPEWRNARHISAAELAERLSGSAKTRPIILQVGFRILYDGAHIPGAIFGGAASTAQGLAKLKAVAGEIPRDKEVVLYCGCCPWEKCPNIRPAYDQLRHMGFSRLVVLLIPQDFAHDWINQGFPVARGK
jgi:thiosulfate/3-mercaptopyruvate sulfurtransferase